MLATRNLCSIMLVISDKDAIFDRHRPTDHYMRVMRVMPDLHYYSVCISVFCRVFSKERFSDLRLIRPVLF